MSTLSKISLVKVSSETISMSSHDATKEAISLRGRNLSTQMVKMCRASHSLVSMEDSVNVQVPL